MTSLLLLLTLQVPLSHANPTLGTAPLYYELGAPFDRAKPTVLVIADGQQFYVRRGAMQDLQEKILGPDFNVVGIVGRGFTDEFTKAAVDVGTTCRDSKPPRRNIRSIRFSPGSTRRAAPPLRCARVELIHPTGGFERVGDGGVHPYLEGMHRIAKLVDEVRSGTLTMPAFDLRAAHTLPTETFLLVARWDQAADYRTAVALAYSYPKHHLFIADDNHLFAKLDDAGLRRRFARTFLRHGGGSAEMRALLKEAEPYRWLER